MRHDPKTIPPRFDFDVGQLSGHAAAVAGRNEAIKLDIRHVGFAFGDKPALRDISLPIHANRVTALIGPSGCGKSTLLRVLNRMADLYEDQHASGTVLLDGVDILTPETDVLTLRRRVGMVTQKPSPFPLSIYDNVAIGLRLNEDLSTAELDARVEDALRRAALWEEVHHLLDHSALSLSGGQQQRLCLARTMAVRPEVILLDEPCSALDPISTAKIETTIESLKPVSTVVIVTHNLQQAARLSDYTAFLYLGELIEFGTTEQIFAAPRDERTARYVTGRMG